MIALRPFLIRMSAFLAIVVAVCAALFSTLLDAFLANPANALSTAVFADSPEPDPAEGSSRRLPADKRRTIHRIGAQLLAALLYERKPNGLPALS